MRVVVLLLARNEARVLGRTLTHLAGQDVEVCVLDNGSTDATPEIARSFLGRGVFRIEVEPFSGVFDLRALLGRLEGLAREIPADWFLVQGSDEIREAPAPFATLAAGFAEADRQGYNAVAFDEYVFLPTGDEESFEGTDFVERMEHYYFFEPAPLHHVQAWKRSAAPEPDLRSFGGHRVEFPGRTIFPERFALRHYIALSRSHAIAKYAGRVHRAENLDRGWHGARASFRPGLLRFPARERLKRKTPNGPWDRSDPWTRHELFGEPRPPAVCAPREHDPAPPALRLVGAAGSGTALLRRHLGAHPALAVAAPATGVVPAARGDHTGARFIHVIRDGRDLAPGLSSSNGCDGRRALVDHAGEWAAFVRDARHAAQQGTWLEIHYEDLVADPEPVLRAVCDFVGAPFDPAMLSPRPAGPEDAEPAGSWHDRMTPEARAAWESVAGGLLRDLGYETPPEGADVDALRLHRSLAAARRLAGRRAEELSKLRAERGRLAGLLGGLHAEIARREELLDACDFAVAPPGARPPPPRTRGVR